MIFILLLGLLALVSVIYLRANPLHRADLLLIFFNFSIVFFLSRFNKLITVWLDDRPLITIHFYLLGVLLLLGMARALSNRPLSRTLALPLPFLGLFAVFSMISGLVNAGIDGAIAATQVLVITLLPALVAWVMIELALGYQCRDDNLRKLYILPLGVITPVILLVSALLPDVFGSALGWAPKMNYGGEGFIRGWSPLGSTILTGSLVVVGIGFALHEAVANRSRLHILVAALASASVLFTASRAVMIVFVILNLVYWPMVGKWRAFMRVASWPALVLLALLGWSLISGSASFGRFLVTNDTSTRIRATSAVIAVDLAREKILLGHGPGQIYDEVRTIWIANPGQYPRLLAKVIDGRRSAMEPHNVYLLLLAEHGTLATLSFLAAIFAGLGAVWRLKPGDDNVARSERAVYVGLWVGFAFIFITASWPLVNPQFSVFFWLFVFSGLHMVVTRRGEAAA